MFFSIIIPTYNRASILKETVETVLQQTFADYEIIIVDDGSTDNTAETVRNINNPKINYFHKANEERSIARNYGADKASGEYLIFLDSDDRMKENHLASIHRFIQQQSETPGFIFSGYVILNPDKSVLYEYGVEGFFNSRKLFYGNYLGCSSVIVEQELFKKYYFNTNRDLILFEDWELWLRIIAENKLYCFSGKSIVMINHHGRSVLNYGTEQINSKILHFKNHILKTSTGIKNSFLHRRFFLMGIYSYAALHIAITGKNRLTAAKYLALGFINNPMIIFKRRFFGIIKHLF